MTDLTQGNAFNFMEKIYDAKDTVVSLGNGVGEALKAIGELSKMIIKGIDFVFTAILNPELIFAAIDKLSVVVIISLIILKMLGFEKVDKWIWLTVLLKIVAMAFI